jgi:hypothetical protein
VLIPANQKAQFKKLFGPSAEHMASAPTFVSATTSDMHATPSDSSSGSGTSQRRVASARSKRASSAVPDTKPGDHGGFRANSAAREKGRAGKGAVADPGAAPEAAQHHQYQFDRAHWRPKEAEVIYITHTTHVPGED